MDLVASPIQYGSQQAIPDGARCALCGSADNWLVSDHCHTHGWIRGVLCRRCNVAMAYIDRHITPKAPIEDGHVVLKQLVNYAARCHECPPISIDDLMPAASLRSVAGVVDGPRTVRLKTAIRTEVRLLADRLGVSVNAALSVLLSEALEARGINPATGQPIPKEPAKP